MLDGHIHTTGDDKDPKLLLKSLKMAGMDGGMVISRHPQSFPLLGKSKDPEQRLRDILAYTRGHTRLFPCFWIDPLEKNALKQVDVACKSGINAFKIICNRFYPSDPRAMKIYSAIAARKKPILFHSGILWDGQVSSKFNRPLEFEALLSIRGIVFSLAHISWPWCDELIAVYGKFLNAYSIDPEWSARLYIDLTPGTPVLYREDAAYNVKWAHEWVDRDTAIYKKLKVDAPTRESVFGCNLERFLGLRVANEKPKKLLMGE